ncbi:hypothetical protein CEXT_346501 [Caerostris extrusa]|uniref:Uncharacterized protein n=1 Tax=Caerostris extrusa TaxID=172846 RepID=A0AAV4WR41_CAEEX|nr:hypothetical protein CEXT_346501 [Caerostris extrusa]
MSFLRNSLRNIWAINFLFCPKGLFPALSILYFSNLQSISAIRPSLITSAVTRSRSPCTNDRGPSQETETKNNVSGDETPTYKCKQLPNQTLELIISRALDAYSEYLLQTYTVNVLLDG